MAAILRHELALDPLFIPLTSIPRILALVESRLHLEPTQPGHAAELFRFTGLYSAVSAMGADGIQSYCAPHRAQGRDLRGHCGPCVVLLFGRVSVAAQWPSSLGSAGVVEEAL